jgi:hypothetical protein
MADVATFEMGDVGVGKDNPQNRQRAKTLNVRPEIRIARVKGDLPLGKGGWFGFSQISTEATVASGSLRTRISSSGLPGTSKLD